jgi:hypothetical protein
MSGELGSLRSHSPLTNGVSKAVSESPGASAADSVNVILPGMSTSKR